MTVGLVVVSHSSKIAEGAVELAAQMAPDVKIVAAGGTDDGRIGTSLELVMDAMGSAESGGGVVVLTDLGSAVMTAESALEFIGSPPDILLADAPLVEGLVAAAVAAQGGGTLEQVKSAAEHALLPAGFGAAATATSGATGAGLAETAPAVTGEFVLPNQLGLHARPAAVLAGALSALDVEIEINGVDAQSIMMLMSLAAKQGSTLSVRATGPDAQKAVDFVGQKVQEGFGEL
ncbi:dihydroxyacetone kinase phosphoryl donor subunit DhaM [Pseudarthrobacter sp. J1738]|uniref:dihydroxyacetone kinase phosphoryl donor subunit DhaM n=1 Tax=unclassified Pseudarthrobacter TaxID=2647000 RepID=UPI003D265D6E